MSQNKFENLFRIYEKEAIDNFEQWERNNIELKDYINLLYVISVQENINDYNILECIFENLVINNEIICKENINNYSQETLENKLKLNIEDIAAIKANKIIICVNWYIFKNNKYILKYGKLRISKEMNIINQIEKEIKQNELLH